MNVQQTITPPPGAKPSAEIAETLGLGKARKRRWLSRRRVLAALVIVAALAIGYSMLGGGDTGTVRYITQNAKRGALTEAVTATGTVEPTNKVEISSEQSGTVRSVFADYNDSVKTGETLAVLDTEKLSAAERHAEATLDVQKAQVQEAEATLAEAKQALDRTQALTEKSFASRATQETAEATYRRAVAALAVAKANVEVAEADLETARTNLRKATILSPIDGVVLSRSVEPGQTVAASLSAPVLFTLAENLASMQLEVDVDEADVGQVHAGQDATFTVEAYRDRRFPAKVAEVRYASETTNNVVTYTAVLTLDNTDLLLRPGMTATADIVTAKVDDALLVPNAALRYAPPETAKRATRRGSGLLSYLMPRPPRDRGVAKPQETSDGARSIYVLQNGEPEKVMVKVGATDGTWTEVTEGQLQEGAAVITDSTTGK